MNVFRLRKGFVLFLSLLLAGSLQARQPITYFLPDIVYDPDIPTPEAFFGHQVGEWHLGHAQLVRYMEVLAEKSDRVTLYEYARTHENRPLVHMVITSSENQSRIEDIRLQHLALTDPSVSGQMDVTGMPVVVRLGYGVHGNEPSSHNAAPLVAYYLAAGQGPEVEKILREAVVILDPSLNPDGQDRFASWVNRHKGMTPNPDPANREFRDVWPGSRTNHYWFDLNRDWLPLVHPESEGRVRDYHRWKPNVNTDHHEFGANASFYFQPGMPGRTNHLTPRQTDELTMEIARYHGEAFDRVGQLYYTEDDFDDFYYGKGSSYPDANGSIGILFEQAGLNGHLRETDHGTIHFAYTIRNQVIVSLSTLEAAYHMRDKLLGHLRWFYASAMDEAASHPVKAYVFGDNHDRSKNRHFLQLLMNHQLEVYELASGFNQGEDRFVPGSAWVVPLRQPQFRLVRSLFETVLEFEDSLFYDVSTWTKPLAFNMPYAEVMQPRQLETLMGSRLEQLPEARGRVIGGGAAYAYILPWDDFYAPRALHYLQRHGVRTRVATAPFASLTGQGEVSFTQGSILVPVHYQEIDEAGLYALVQEAARDSGVDFHATDSGWVQDGIFPGSSSFTTLQPPSVLLLVGQGANSREAGEVWHLLDVRFGMPVTMVETERLGSVDLSRYTTLIMVSGSYGDIGEPVRQAVDRWLRGGGTLIALGSANNWLVRHDFAKIEFMPTPALEEPEFLPYNLRSRHYGARRIPGGIFRARIDRTHPLGYGYHRDLLPVYVSGNTSAKPDASPFNNPLMFEKESLMSGYIFEPYLDVINGSAGVITSSRGRGQVISIMDNPNFRGFWFGTNRLFMNAIFFGNTIR